MVEGQQVAWCCLILCGRGTGQLPPFLFSLWVVLFSNSVISYSSICGTTCCFICFISCCVVLIIPEYDWRLFDLVISVLGIARITSISLLSGVLNIDSSLNFLREVSFNICNFSSSKLLSLTVVQCLLPQKWVLLNQEKNVCLYSGYLSNLHC